MNDLQKLYAEFQFAYDEWANRRCKEGECPWLFRKLEWGFYVSSRDAYFKAARLAYLADLH